MRAPRTAQPPPGGGPRGGSKNHLQGAEPKGRVPARKTASPALRRWFRSRALDELGAP